MSFFKDFKEDFFQAVNDIVPGEGEGAAKELDGSDVVVNTLEQDVDVASELMKSGRLFEEEGMTPGAQQFAEEPVRGEEERIMAVDTEERSRGFHEVSVITEGTSVKGDIETAGALEIRGELEGNVQCGGKMTVTGTLHGDIQVGEVFIDGAKVEGDVTAEGTVKIGIGSIVVGNIVAGSAAVAGAVKGDLDVKGQVVVDTSAIIKGNIKSCSMQINNGAVIEGFCSQCYAKVDMESPFGEGKEQEDEI